MLTNYLAMKPPPNQTPCGDESLLASGISDVRQEMLLEKHLFGASFTTIRRRLALLAPMKRLSRGHYFLLNIGDLIWEQLRPF